MYESNTLVYQHLVGGGITEPPYTDFEVALELAWRQNVSIKVPVQGEICPRQSRLLPDFKFEVAPPLFEMPKDSFGRERMTWGSDWYPSGGQVVTSKRWPV